MLQNHSDIPYQLFVECFQKDSQEGLKGTIPKNPSFYFKETWTILHLPSLCVVLPSWKTLEKLWAQNISSEAAPLPFFKNSFPLPPPCPPLTPPHSSFSFYSSSAYSSSSSCRPPPVSCCRFPDFCSGRCCCSSILNPLPISTGAIWGRDTEVSFHGISKPCLDWRWILPS